jgi:hypothetical protein
MLAYRSEANSYRYFAYEDDEGYDIEHILKSVLDLPPADRVEAKQLVTTFLEQRRGRSRETA